MLSLNSAAFSSFVGLLLNLFLCDQRQHANVLHGLQKFVLICLVYILYDDNYLSFIPYKSRF